MNELTFRKLKLAPNTVEQRFAAACRNDYITPEGCSVWYTWTDYDELAVAFLDAKGTGLILVSKQPAKYVAWSKDPVFDAQAAAVCPDEWEVTEDDEPIDVSGDTFTIQGSATLF